MKTGEKIRQLRKALNLSQTELGEKVGVKKNAVSKWECGRVEDIPTSTVKELANIFGVSAAYLIEDDSEQEAEKEKPISETDRLLLSKLNMLTPERRAVILQMIDIAIASRSDE